MSFSMQLCAAAAAVARFGRDSWGTGGAASDRATGVPLAVTVATAAAMINCVMLVRMIASIQ
jgi:hypothetical protein